jgi:hypothetical protein
MNIPLSSEQQLAHTMRRALLVQIAEVDLPQFLVVEMEQVLFGLNYYKLGNLVDHKDEFLVFLKHLATTYQKSVLHCLRKRESELAEGVEAKEFATTYLHKHGYNVVLLSKERVKLRSTFAVMCTLQMKEFIYRKRGTAKVPSTPISTQKHS